MANTVYRIGGMHCPQCELAVKRAALKTPGVSDAYADASKGILTLTADAALDEAVLKTNVSEAGYTLLGRKGTVGTAKTVLIVLGAIAAVFGLFLLFVYTPINAILGQIPVVREGMSLGAVFLVGLLTSLHCVAMCGGINLAQSANAAQARRIPTANLLYNLGRVLSYTATGAIVGGLGQVLKLSPKVQAAIQMIAAVWMLLMALNLAGVIPKSLSLPVSWHGRLTKGRTSSLWIGLLNGLMPCGPLQAMQLYALSSGSWWMGAASMFVFAIGTVPLMLGFGLLGGRLNKRAARPMRIASGVLVLIMAMAMLTNGASLMGLNLRVFGTQSAEASASEGAVQQIRSELDWRGYPDITVKKGVPVRWTIHAEARKLTSCNSEIVIPALGMRIPLSEGDNLIEFTAEEAGVIPYTCWMGMLHGSITVTE